MKILNGYIRRHILFSTLIVVLVLLGVELLIELISELSDIGVENYGIMQALVYVPLRLPSDLYQLFPMAGFLGCLLGLGQLASTNQLVVMRASGVSISKIASSVIKTAILMMVVVTFVGEYLAPTLELKAQIYKSMLLNKAIGFKAIGGIWLRNGEQFVRIGGVDSSKQIKGISAFFIDDKHQLRKMAFSNKGYNENGVWTLHNALLTDTSNINQLKTSKINNLPLAITLNPQSMKDEKKTVEQMSVRGLYESILYRNQAGLATGQYWFNFWQRIIWPFTTIVMIGLGVPFIFGSLRNVSTGSRIMMGIVVGFSFYMLNQFFGPIVMVYQFSPFAAALLPTLLFGTICVILLKKVN